MAWRRALSNALELSVVVCRIDVCFVCLAAIKQRFVLRALLIDAAYPLGRDVGRHPADGSARGSLSESAAPYAA